MLTRWSLRCTAPRLADADAEGRDFMHPHFVLCVALCRAGSVSAGCPAVLLCCSRTRCILSTHTDFYPPSEFELFVRLGHIVICPRRSPIPTQRGPPTYAVLFCRREQSVLPHSCTENTLSHDLQTGHSIMPVVLLCRHVSSDVSWWMRSGCLRRRRTHQQNLPHGRADAGVRRGGQGARGCGYSPQIVQLARPLTSWAPPREPAQSETKTTQHVRRPRRGGVCLWLARRGGGVCAAVFASQPLARPHHLPAAHGPPAAALPRAAAHLPARRPRNG
ncbi:hypothetical protein B0H13DRAFT_194420 [Mycena leptocephala]|nr:hypothetical protein B0H13DRAFT_194420 [Mycena leptocephala]